MVAWNSKSRRGKRAVSKGKLLSPTSAASPPPSSRSPRSPADPGRDRTAPPPSRIAPQPPPGDGTPRTLQAPSPTSLPAAKSCSYTRRCVVLVDWWLERMDDKIYISGLMETPQMRKGGYSSQGKKGSASRVFNCAITKRCDYSTVETENGYLVWIKGIMNNSRMRENGFSKQVCETFMGGFPNQWKELLDSNMEDIGEHSQSPLNPADAALDELLLEKFMSDTFASKKEYSFTESNFSSFRNLESFDFEEPGTSKCYKTSVNLGTQNASEVPAAGMTPLSGAVRVSEKNEVRTLRSGLVLGGPISAPRTGGNKRKRAQHKASNNKMSPNEVVSPTVDLTSRGNGPSPAGIVAEDKLQSHDSPSKGQ